MLSEACNGHHCVEGLHADDRRQNGEGCEQCAGPQPAECQGGAAATAAVEHQWPRTGHHQTHTQQPTHVETQHLVSNIIFNVINFRSFNNIVRDSLHEY